MKNNTDRINRTKLIAKDYSSKKLKEILSKNNVIELYGKEPMPLNYYDTDIYPGYFDKRSWIDNEGVWHVEPFAIIEHGSAADVYIICPLCGMIHNHGISINTEIPIEYNLNDDELSYEDPHPRYADELMGHRVAHCGEFRKNKKSKIINDGYYIDGPTIGQVLNNYTYGLKVK